MTSLPVFRQTFGYSTLPPPSPRYHLPVVQREYTQDGSSSINEKVGYGIVFVCWSLVPFCGVNLGQKSDERMKRSSDHFAIQRLRKHNFQTGNF